MDTVVLIVCVRVLNWLFGLLSEKLLYMVCFNIVGVILVSLDDGHVMSGNGMLGIGGVCGPGK